MTKLLSPTVRIRKRFVRLRKVAARVGEVLIRLLDRRPELHAALGQPLNERSHVRHPMLLFDFVLHRMSYHEDTKNTRITN